MSQWLRGIVKEVGPSADQLTIVGGSGAEKRLTLASLVAPRIGKRDGSVKDEPFAWEAREFLRKLLVGKPVVFKIDYAVESINREFGSVFVNTSENVAISLVANGWAKVKSSPNASNPASPYLEDLKKAEELAQASGLGAWTKDPEAIQQSVKASAEAASLMDDSFNAMAFLQQTGKGGTVAAIVEQVINGSMLRVTLLPTRQQAMIQVCGVQAPSMGRKPQGFASLPAAGEGGPGEGQAPPVVTAASIAASGGGGGGAAVGPEPFSKESKVFTESKALQRDVTLIVEGVDKYNNLFASLLLPPINSSGRENLGELLVQEGLAKVMEFSVSMLSSGAQKMRDLERAAKLSKLRIWTNYVPTQSNQAKLTDAFLGKVIEVVSGDCIVVKEEGSGGKERRLQLSSLRAPRTATRDRAAEPWANDAKDFLRKKIVGRQVEVKMEYVRKVPALDGTGAGAAGGGAGERELLFANIELLGEGKGEEKANVGEMVAARGFATVLKHKSDEERSRVYDKLLECEELAKQAKRGMHSTKEQPPNRINDVSQPGSASKAKQYLPFFQRAGRMQAVVEHVLSGHRLKLMVPKEGAMIVFAPSGIRTPSRVQPGGNGKQPTPAEPYAEEAIAFTREHCMQRDVEVIIDGMDRGGTFLGQIFLSPSPSPANGLPSGPVNPSKASFNLPLALLTNGLARVQPGLDASRLGPEGHLMMEAQKAAKEARLRVWEKWTPEMEMDATESSEGLEGEFDGLGLEGGSGAATSASRGGGGAKKGGEVLEVVVTEVAAPDEIFVQLVKEPRVAWLSEQLRAVGLTPDPIIPPELKAGQLCLARFSLDKSWYRAYVEKLHGMQAAYDVFFVDYGNREKVKDGDVRLIDGTLSAVPPQAHLATLANIKVPKPSSEHYADAKACLTSLLSSGQTLLAHVGAREKPGQVSSALALGGGTMGSRHPKFANGRISLTLIDPDSGLNVAQEMLLSGLAQLPKIKKVRDQDARDAVKELQEFEDEAREARRGIFQYGDPGDSDDEAPSQVKAGAWGVKR